MKKSITSLLAALAISATAQTTTYISIDGDTVDAEYTRNNPYMEVYAPQNGNGTAVVICPGGGYRYKTMDYEGRNFAPFFNSNGITLFVLSYTLPDGNCELPLACIESAMRGIKKHARNWGIDPARIGVMGASAGGHLASTLATAFHPDTRPAFQILLYPVISMDSTITHAGSRLALLGNSPSTHDVERFSNERQVKPDTPPAYIMLSQDDNSVPIENSLRYYRALTQQHIPAELHLVPTGGHGWGCHETFAYHQLLLASLQQWLHTYAIPAK